jgi:hypothetical protein
MHASEMDSPRRLGEALAAGTMVCSDDIHP